MPAPSANAFAAPVLATPTASTVRWIPSPPLPPLALVTRFGIVVTHSATSQIVSVPASLPAHLYPPPLPSKLSCVRRSPRSSSLPPGVEAAERTRKSLHTVTCYHPSLLGGGRDIDWFKTRVPDQTQKRPHFIQSVNRPAPSTPQEHTAQTKTNFHVNGWATGPCKLKTLAQGVCVAVATPSDSMMCKVKSWLPQCRRFATGRATEKSDSPSAAPAGLATA